MIDRPNEWMNRSHATQQYNNRFVLLCWWVFFRTSCCKYYFIFNGICDRKQVYLHANISESEGENDTNFVNNNTICIYCEIFGEILLTKIRNDGHRHPIYFSIKVINVIWFKKWREEKNDDAIMQWNQSVRYIGHGVWVVQQVCIQLYIPFGFKQQVKPFHCTVFAIENA